jgi:acetyltransferase-like isoleucine patch superfamily enzyme
MASFGKYSYGAGGSPHLYWTNDNAKLVVGSFSSIASNCKMYLGGGNHRHDCVTTYPFGHIHQDIFNTYSGTPVTTKGDIVIGSDVWIGANVTIMSGVTLGDGVVVANNSHVVSNAEPYSLVGGNPAKFIKYRFKPEQIEKLLQIKWWNWDDVKINEYASLLCDSDIDKFINLALENKENVPEPAEPAEPAEPEAAAQ